MNFVTIYEFLFSENAVLRGFPEILSLSLHQIKKSEPQSILTMLHEQQDLLEITELLSIQQYNYILGLFSRYNQTYFFQL